MLSTKSKPKIKKPAFSPLKKPESPKKSPSKSPRKTPTKSPSKSIDQCEIHINNPFLREDLRELCGHLVIDWSKLYPDNPTKQELCKDFYKYPNRIPTLRDIPETERIPLKDIGPLSTKLRDFCSGTERNLYRRKFKKTMMERGDIDVIYSKFKPVSRKERIEPLIFSESPVRKLEPVTELLSLILLKYLERKHKDTCIVFGYPDAIAYNYSEYKIDNDMIPSIGEEYLSKGLNPDDFLAIIPYPDTNTSKLIKPISIDFDDAFIRKYQYCRKDYLFGLIKLTNDKSDYLHANAFIIDKPRKIFYFYEPNGIFEPDQFFFMKLLKQKLIETFHETFTIIPFGGTCDWKGLQYLESRETEDPIIDAVINDPGGYCAYFSIWILDMALENPDIPPDLIPKYAHKNIRKIRDFIRGFAVFINSILKDYQTILERNSKEIKSIPGGKIFLLQNIIDFYLDIDEEI